MATILLGASETGQLLGYWDTTLRYIVDIHGNMVYNVLTDLEASDAMSELGWHIAPIRRET